MGGDRKNPSRSRVVQNMDHEPSGPTSTTPQWMATSLAAPPTALGTDASGTPPQPIGGSVTPAHYPLWNGPPYRTAAAWPAASMPRKPKPQPRPYRPVELAAVLGVVALTDICLWASGDGTTREESGLGLGFALLFAAVPVLLFFAARARRTRGSVRLGVVVALLTLVAARCAYCPTTGTVLSGLMLVGAFVVALRARSAFVPEIVLAAVSAVPKLASRIGAASAGVVRLAGRTRLGNVSVLPIVVPAGLVAMFLGVFALANPVVARGLGTAWTAMTSVLVLPSFGRITLWASAAVAGVSLLRPACRLASGGENASTSSEAKAPALLVARNALVGLNLLFFAYNAIDATYLWSGSPPAGMGTQEYAHAGAFWLTVALLMLTAVIGVMFRDALAHDAQAKTARWLAFAWMGQGVILAVGTYRRIAIHIAKSGLSDLRIVGILGTTLVVCGVVLVAWKLRERKTFTWLLRRQLDAFALVSILYAVAPTHLVSAHVNVARVQSGEYRPLLHAFRQSHEMESAAAYLPLLEHPDGRVRQGIAALLQDEHEKLRARHRFTAEPPTWRERDLASGHALASLDEASDRIEVALDGANPVSAKRVLLEISRAANEDRSIEELLAIPAAARDVSEYDGTRSRVY